MRLKQKPKPKWSGWEKFPKTKIAFAGATSEGVGLIRFKHRLSPHAVVHAAHSLGLSLSDELHPERRKHLDVRDERGALVAVVNDYSVVLLPKRASAAARKKGVEFVNALLE